MRHVASIIIQKILSFVATITIMSILVFVLVEIMPGDVAHMILGQSATEESLAQLREARGLNDPLLQRYGRWLSGVLRGDLGESLYMRGIPINTILWRRVGHSIALAATAFVLFVPLSLFFGILAGVRNQTMTDKIVSFFGLATMALPEFVSGVFLISIFSIRLGWLPITSVIPIGDSLSQHADILFLPAVSIMLVMFGYVSRMQRSSMIQVMKSDYIRAAILKGMSYRRVVFHHALRNALLPSITIIGMNMGWLFGGLVVVETLFGFPGMGLLLMTAIKTRDVPLIEACVLLITGIYAVSTMLTDVLHSVLNPRIRLAGGR